MPLPLLLDGMGAPGCALLVDPLLISYAVTDTQGQATFDLTFGGPAHALVGVQLYAQWGALTIANPLGIATSDMLELIVLP